MASAQQADAALADPATSPARRAEILRAKAVTDNPERIRPDHVVDASGTLEIAGRPLDLHLARFAASEGDVWLYDRDLRVAIVGDLVVGLVPFMDTACTDGWLRALDEVEQVPFKVLIPGHGPQMDRNDFLLWKAAFTEFVRCGRSNTEKRRCVEGWERKAAKFIDEEHRDYLRGAANYYLETRLRSTPEEQDRYCRSLSVPS